MSVTKFLKRKKRLLVIFTTPVLLLPIPLVFGTPQSKCAYGLILMSVYWITEAFPLPVTSMLPAIIFPMMGIAKPKEVAQEYFKDVTFLFIGGYSVAIAIENWNLHKRFALRFLMLLGSKPEWLMLGILLTTSFISMWMGNIATTTMMIPIVQAILVELFKTKKLTSVHLDQTSVDVKNANHISNTELQETTIEVSNLDVDIDEGQLNSFLEDDRIDIDNLDKKSRNLCKSAFLCICYGSNLGGVATLTGTAPNLVMKGHADIISGGQSGISFLSWFIFSFPVVVITVFLCWLTLQLFFFGWRDLFTSNKEESTAVKNVIQKEYKKLGKIAFAEKTVLVLFVILVLLWLTRDPDFVPGWQIVFPKGYMHDSVPAIAILLMLFIIPSRQRKSRDGKSSEFIEESTLLSWKGFSKKFPWGIPILLGSGFALAFVFRQSGLSASLASQMKSLRNIPVWAMVLTICFVVSFSTEFVGNTPVCSIFMPILADLAINIKLNPIYLMLPAAITTSFAFMLPVATPPNALVFAYGYLNVMDMVKVGFVLNILCVLVVVLGINTWGRMYFNLDVFPDWATTESTYLTNPTNITTYLINTTEETVTHFGSTCI